MVILIFFFTHWYISLFFQTFFHHRYAAHQMFTMTKFWEKVFIFFSWVTQGSSYLPPGAYAILHRLHHAYADTRRDPHSPKYSKNILTMMWKTKIIFSKICRNTFPVKESFKKNIPVWPWFEKHLADRWHSRIMWGTLYVAFYVYAYWFWDVSLWWFLLLPIHFLMGPVHGAVINWFAHVIGSVRFKMKNTSKNLMPIDLFMLGEGYHNNHHEYSGRANFGVKWYEVDPVYPFILLFHSLRIIRLKSAPTSTP